MIRNIPSLTFNAKEESIWKKFNSSLIKSSNLSGLSFWKSNLSIILCKHVPAKVPLGKSLKGLERVKYLGQFFDFSKLVSW